MKQALRSGWLITLMAGIGLVCALGLGAVGYWKYATSVPPFVPPLSPMPKPNGYERAINAVNRFSQLPRPPTTAHWPKGTPEQLRAQVGLVRPVLDDVRASFRLQWRSPPSLSFNDRFPEYAGFRECARCFSAESILARRRGDDGAAMQRSLDAMELGSRIPTVGAILARQVGMACHAIGFSQVEALVQRSPANVTAAALERVQRLRRRWPPIAETLEGERITMLSGLTQVFEDFLRQPLNKQIGALASFQPGLGRWDTVRAVLIPRRIALANLDRYYRERIAESKKPSRRRRPIPTPGDPWSQFLLQYGDDSPEYTWRFEWPATQLALLEVALAVRLYRLKHGRYPADLRAVRRQWLPSIPLDQWDQPVAYRLKGGKPLVYSLGPDGKDDRGLAANMRHLGKTVHGDLVFGKLGRSVWSE
jgi:hypothetical protein